MAEARTEPPACGRGIRSRWFGETAWDILIVTTHHGVVRARKGARSTITVRKVSFGEGVERVFPVNSPLIDSITVVRRGRTRRAKLYYLRDLRGKASRLKTDVGRQERDRAAARSAKEASNNKND